MKSNLAICLILFALLIGCNDYSSELNVNPTPFSLGIDEYSAEFVYSQYDTIVSGIIQLQKIKSKICVNDSSNIFTDNTYYLSNAIFFDENENRLYAGNLAVNSFNYELFNGNFYHNDGHQNEHNSFAFEYGSLGNLFEKSSSQEFPAFDTTLYFYDDITINSHSYNDTIMGSNNLHITWAGTNPNNFVRILITEQNSKDSTGQKIHAHSFFTYNDGSHTISSNILSEFPDGMYYLSIASYEPRYIKVDNMPDISVIAKSEEMFSIRIIN